VYERLEFSSLGRAFLKISVINTSSSGIRSIFVVDVYLLDGYLLDDPIFLDLDVEGTKGILVGASSLNDFFSSLSAPALGSTFFAADSGDPARGSAFFFSSSFTLTPADGFFNYSINFNALLTRSLFFSSIYIISSILPIKSVVIKINASLHNCCLV
jgi:hypothetical protein